MEGLHYRKKEKANQEDEAEFLDEEGSFFSLEMITNKVPKHS